MRVILTACLELPLPPPFKQPGELVLSIAKSSCSREWIPTSPGSGSFQHAHDGRRSSCPPKRSPRHMHLCPVEICTSLFISDARPCGCRCYFFCPHTFQASLEGRRGRCLLPRPAPLPPCRWSLSANSLCCYVIKCMYSWVQFCASYTLKEINGCCPALPPQAALQKALLAAQAPPLARCALAVGTAGRGQRRCISSPEWC